MVREFLAADVEGIESVGAVGAVFEQVFLGLSQVASDCNDFIGLQRFSILAGLVFTEVVASATDPCRLNGDNQALVV